jgi:malate synthase
MAAKVGKQYAGDKLDPPLVGGFEGAAYEAASELVFKGLTQALR